MKVRTKKAAASKRKVNKPSKGASKAKKIDWDKYVGKIKFPVDGLTYQQQMRDEWER